MMKKLSVLFLLLLFILVVPLQLQAASVKLNWQPNTEPDLSGYNIYYGTQSRNYETPLPAGDDTTFTISGLDDGKVYYFAVSAVDNAGNESGFSNEQSITVSNSDEPEDSIAPVVTITSPTHSNTFITDSAQITVAGTAVDTSTIENVILSLPTGYSRIVNGTDNWSLTGTLPSEGIYTITVSAEDAYGNIGQDTITINYTTEDNNPPRIDITYPSTSNAYEAGTATINLGGTATDDVGLQQITWISSTGDRGIASNTNDWTIDTIELAEGKNIITVTAIDTSGNQANDTIAVTYSAADTQAPVVSITTPAAPSGNALQTTSGSLQITGTAQDNRDISHVTWSLGGTSDVAEGTTNWTIPSLNLSAGLNTISVTAEDAAGNKGSATLLVMYTIPDTVAPVVVITTPTSADVFTSESGQISLAGTAGDDRNLQQITWSSSTGNSGTASGFGNWSISGINLAKGVQVITVTATDDAGNRSSDKLTVTYDAADTTAPTVEITSPTTKTYYFSKTDTVAVGGRASDDVDLAKVTWRNSRGESGTCNGTDNWQASGIKLNRWWNTITVTAIDNAGNTNEYSLKVFGWR